MISWKTFVVSSKEFEATACGRALERLAEKHPSLTCIIPFTYPRTRLQHLGIAGPGPVECVKAAWHLSLFEEEWMALRLPHRTNHPGRDRHDWYKAPAEEQ